MGKSSSRRTSKADARFAVGVDFSTTPDENHQAWRA
jgi:hypothetical protein